MREILSGQFAAHEILTYSFVSKKLQEIVGEDPADSYRIVNSLSPELQCFRQSITPSLLEKVRDNLKAGYQKFSIYELNQATKKSYGLDCDGVPKMRHVLSFVTIGDYYQAKAVLSALLSDLGIDEPEYTAYNNNLPFLESQHSATVNFSKSDYASLGEIKSHILKKLKISEPVSIFELDLESLLAAIPPVTMKAKSLSRFPSVERDLTLKVSSDLPFSKVIDPIISVFKANDLNIEMEPVSIYQPPAAHAKSEQNKKSISDHTDSAPATKNLSFHLCFNSQKKTLDNNEISAIIDEVSKSVKQAVGAEVV